MRAIITSPHDLELVEIEDPVPASNEMLVRVEAVSLNRGEIRMVELAKEGTIPGWDVAGTVVRTAADGKGHPEGAKVAAILRSGGWAELAAVPRHAAAAIPEGVSFEDSATLPIAGLTALRALSLVHPLLGRRVLVSGASGGVGRFAVQLARRGGAEVTGIASAERTDAVRRLGADATVRSADESDGEFDLILESVGGPSLASAIDRIAPGGVIVSIGNSSERETTFDPRALYRKNGATIHGLLIFDDVDSGRIGPRELRYLLELVETGELETSIGLQLGWSEFGVAIERLRDRAIEGKAVLKIG